MNCDQFQELLHQRLDERTDPQDDALLCEHADVCAACHCDLAMWTEIDQTLSMRVPSQQHKLPPTSNTHVPHRAGLRWLVAAGILVVVFGVYSRPANDRQIANVNSQSLDNVVQPTEHGVDDAPRHGSAQDTTLWVDAQWWATVSEEPWIESTIPAMDSVRQGIAPISRSMRQAIAILMNRHSPTPSTTLPPEPGIIDGTLGSPPVEGQSFRMPSEVARERLA